MIFGMRAASACPMRYPVCKQTKGGKRKMSEISEVFNQVFVVLNMISLILSRLSFVGIFFCLLATFLTEKKGKPDSGKSKFQNGIPVCILLCVIFSTTRLFMLVETMPSYISTGRDIWRLCLCLEIFSLLLTFVSVCRLFSNKNTNKNTDEDNEKWRELSIGVWGLSMFLLSMLLIFR